MKGETVQVQGTPTIIAGSVASQVGTTNVNVAAGAGNVSLPTACLIRNPAGGLTIYLGGSAVTAALGCPLAAGEDIEMDLVNEILYGVIASTTTSTTIKVLRRGD